MRLEGISYRLGSQVVSNDEIISRIFSWSKEMNENSLEETLSQIRFYFDYSGIKSRRWLAQGEKPIDLVCSAVKEVLHEAGVSKDDCGLLMHVGLGRGFVEAGQAYFIAQAMDMGRVHCFDIMDACNSWPRGLFLAYNLLKNGFYERILVVNTECNMMEKGIINPHLFQFRSFDQVYHNFPGLTLGDGVTATLLSKDDSREWEFHFVSRPDHADLCAVPLENYESFSHPSKYLGKNGPHRFYSYMREMQQAIEGDVIKAFFWNSVPYEDLDWVFPHGHSKSMWEHGISKLGWDVRKLKWNTYEYFGNLASASVPTAMAMGMESGEVKRGHKVITWVASGGLSFSSMSFVL